VLKDHAAIRHRPRGSGLGRRTARAARRAGAKVALRMSTDRPAGAVLPRSAGSRGSTAPSPTKRARGRRRAARRGRRRGSGAILVNCAVVSVPPAPRRERGDDGARLVCRVIPL